MNLNDKMIEDWFKDHEAIREKHISYSTSVVDFLKWTRKDSYTYRINYFHWMNTLMVTGDLGEAIYCWGEKNSLEWIAETSIDYFASKCLASETGRGSMSWDGDVALKKVTERLDTKELKQFFEDNGGNEAIESEQEWIAWLHENGDDCFGSDFYEWVGDVGRVISLRCRAHLIGLKMAMERIKK